jgi:hypothetical protein
MGKDESKVQSQSQYGRISYDQQPNKTRLLNLRINKSVSKKADKANTTLDALPLQPPAIRKKANLDLKPERVSSSQHPSTSKTPGLRMNTVDLRESPKK